MKAFVYGIFLQWKLDLRNRDIIIVYYVVPLVFYAFMGGIFTTMNPLAYETIISSMIIFGVTMGAYLGVPNPLVEMYGSEMKKSYKVGGIPLYIPAINNFISACIHLFIMSLCILWTAPFIYEGVIPENMLVFLCSLFVFIITSVSIGTVLGLLVKSASKLVMFSQVLFLPSIMLSGIMFPSNLLPDVMRYVGYIFPATWGYQMMNDTVFLWNTFLPLLIILTIALILNVVLLRALKKQ